MNDLELELFLQKTCSHDVTVRQIVMNHNQSREIAQHVFNFYPFTLTFQNKCALSVSTTFQSACLQIVKYTCAIAEVIVIFYIHSFKLRKLSALSLPIHVELPS